MAIEGPPYLPIIMAREACMAVYYNGYSRAYFPAYYNG
jgi:hypothetical protein